MDYRKYIIVLLLFTAPVIKARAQSIGFQQADSTTLAYYLAADWKQLIIAGKTAEHSGLSFPNLHLRMGFAYYLLGNYSAAINEYQKVLTHDSYNQTARYYSSICYTFLNNDLFAAKQENYLDSVTYKQYNKSTLALVSASLESSYKVAQNNNRGNASYTRFSLSNRLTNSFQLDQSVAYFGQYIYAPASGARFKFKDNQTEYFARLSYAASGHLTLLGAYHYLNTKFRSRTYNSYLFLGGIDYAGTGFDIQADVNVGNIIDEHISQYNTKLTIYPLGNLNLYFVERGAWLDRGSTDNFVFAQTVGYKVAQRFWMESAATFGNLNNYIEADGLYIYNAIDNTMFKAGQTIYYQLNAHSQLQLNYTFEKKEGALQTVNYNQHSITAGLLWKF